MLGKSFNHFIVPVRVIKDGKDFISGTMGSVSNSGDYKPNKVKNMVIQHYLKEFPKSKISVVRLPSVKKVSEEEYLKESENFLPIEVM